MTLRLAFALALTVAVPVAHAGTIEGDSRIDAVALHPDGAVVTRTITVDIPAGPTEVVLRDIPATADEDSIKVDGSGDAPLAILGYEVLARNAEPPRQPKELQSLRDARDEETAKLDAVDETRTFVRSLVKSQPAPDKDGRSIDVENLQKAWAAVGQALATGNEEARRIKVRIREIDERIAEIESRSGRPPTRGVESLLVTTRPVRNVVVTVNGERPGKATLRVSYRVVDARWSALYDMRLSTGNATEAPSLDIVRRAVTRQSSGEDWNDVALTILSTPMTRPTQGPSVVPMRTGVYAAPSSGAPPVTSLPRPDMATRTIQGGVPISADMARLLAASEQGRNAIPSVQAQPVQASQPVSIVQSHGIASAFQVPGRVSVTGNGSPRTVRLSEERVAASIRADVAPRLDPTAYLTAEFTWKGESPLFSGQVLLERDDVPVGRGVLPFVAPGETRSMGFGADDLIRVTRSPDKGQTSEPGLLSSTRTQSIDAATTVRNNHPTAMDVRITDAVPYPDQEEVVVDAVALSPQIEPATPGAGKGLVTWKRKLAPGASIDTRIAYTLKWPASRTLYTTPAQ